MVLVLLVGTVVGCSGGKDGAAADPKPANPQGNPKLKIQGDRGPEKASSAVKE